MPASANRNVLDVEVNLGLSNLPKFTQQVRDIAAAKTVKFSLDSSKLEKDWKTAVKTFSDTFASSIKDSEGLLSKIKIDALRDQFRSIAPQWEKELADALYHTQALANATLDKAAKEDHKQKKQAAEEQLVALQKRLNAESAGVRKLIDQRKKDAAKAEKWAGESRAERGAKHVGSAFTAIKGADFAAGGSFAKALGSFLNKKGTAVQNKAGDKGGESGKVLGNLGKVLGGLGKGILVLGGLAAGIAALVAIVMELDTKTKEWNKSLIEAGVSGGDLANTGLVIGEAFDRARAAFTSYDFAKKWNKTAEESMKVVGALNEAGYAMKRYVNETQTAEQSTAALQDRVGTMYGLAGGLGVEVTSLADTVGQYMDELALSFGGVKEGLNDIFKSAMASGFGTKRFFSQVLQATTGMSMYNVRLADTAGLLLKLTKILGIRAGGEMLTSLGKGFMGESRTDSAKRSLTTGLAETKRIIAADTKASIGALADKITKQQDEGGEKGAAASGVANLLIQRGIDISNPTELADKMADMSRKEQSELAGAVGTMDKDLSRELFKLIDLARGQKGDALQVGSALDSLSAGGTLAMQLKTGYAVFGKPLAEMNDIELAAVEANMGLSREQTKQLRMIDADLRQQYKTEGAAGESYEEFVTKVGAKAAEGIETPLSTAERATLDVVQNTMTLADLIGHGTNGILNTIADYVSGIAAWLIGGENKDEKLAKQGLVKMANQQAQVAREAGLDVEKQIAAKRKGLAEPGLKKDDRAALEEEITTLERARGGLRDTEKKSRQAGYDIQNLDASGAGKGVDWLRRAAAPLLAGARGQEVDIGAAALRGQVSVDSAATISNEKSMENVVNALLDPSKIRKDEMIRGAVESAKDKKLQGGVDKLVTETMEERKTRERSAVISALGSMGYSGNLEDAYKALAAGTPDEQLRGFVATNYQGFLGSVGGDLGGSMMDTLANMAPAKDFIIGEHGIQKFSRGDLVMGVDEASVKKAGGRGVGGGMASNVTINNHFYQDREGNARGLQNMLETIGIG